MCIIMHLELHNFKMLVIEINKDEHRHVLWWRVHIDMCSGAHGYGSGAHGYGSGAHRYVLKV